MSSGNATQGTIAPSTSLGLSGPRLKDNGGVVQHRNFDDNAFVRAQGADPTSADDFVTKRYVDQNNIVAATPSTSGPRPSGSWADIPEMSVSFTPRGTTALLSFESTVQCDPSAQGDTAGAQFRITVGGTPVAASVRTRSMTASDVSSLAPGDIVGGMSYISYLITGLTAGVAVDIAVQFIEVSGHSGIVECIGTERSMHVRDVIG